MQVFNIRGEGIEGIICIKTSSVNKLVTWWFGILQSQEKKILVRLSQIKLVETQEEIEFLRGSAELWRFFERIFF